MAQEPDNSSVRQEYEQWDKAHGRMTDAPPAEGHRYIQHALNLLDLLKPMSEIHPIAKVVVGCFEQMVLFEKDRHENDSRVASVILAQAGMMRVLLDIDDLTVRPKNNPSTLRAIIELPQLLKEVQTDISVCHNSVDTYYKEHRLVKLYRAKEWREKMLEFIGIFDKHRVLLHQVLSLQVASDVSDLVSKMDLLLGRLFSPHEPWELDVTAKIHAIAMAKGESWINDPHVIQSLAIATGDSSVDLKAHPSDIIWNTKIGVQLSVLKEDLQLSLDVLCRRNAELFELKLRLHTERLEKAILHSARFVITSLSGPHDRLEHEDLRLLWKEMNWIFCVETKVFGIALFEYYLDLYSNGMYSTGSHDTGLWMPKLNPLYIYRSGSLKHPHAWTLLYLFLYADKISNAFDSDKSGLIRISEANAFTSQIPDGWTLPQWCAFLVEGQFHENSIYRKRIIHLKFKALEMQPRGKSIRLLPHNRYPAAEYMSSISARMLHYFVLEPRGSKLDTPITPELHELVRNKMLDQDEQFRTRLRSINWTIPNRSTVEAISDGRPLETYIFPLLTVLMELMLDMHHLSLSKAIDFKEWLVPYTGFLSVRATAVKHLEVLKSRFFAYLLFEASLGLLLSVAERFDENTGKSMDHDLQTYHQGMWALFEKVLDAKDMSRFMKEGYEMDLAPVLQQDYDDFYSDQSFLEEFPLPQFTGSLLSLKYCSWEDYKKGKDPADIPLEQPMTWNPIDDEVNKKDLLSIYRDLPQSDWGCDKCDDEPGSERAIECLECYDFDFCRRCYGLDPSEHKVLEHDFSHVMALRSMWLHPFRTAWIKFRAQVVKSHLAEKVKKNTVDTLPPSEQSISTGGSEGDEASGSADLRSIGTCARCAVQILNWETLFYVCGDYACAKQDVILCNECAWTNEFPEGYSHFWWHSLLPFNWRNLDTLECNDKDQEPHAQPCTVLNSKPTDISVVVGRTVEPLSARQNSSLLPVDMGSPLAETPPTTNNSEVKESVEELKGKVLRLDEKITLMTMSNSQNHDGMEQRMDAMEAKLTGVEEKLDAMMVHLREVMDALLVTRS